MKSIAWAAAVVGAALLAAACTTTQVPSQPGAAPLPQRPDQAPQPPAAATPAEEPSRYACEGDRVLRFVPSGDALSVVGMEPQPQVLLRDAGGVGPQQSVWANEQLRVELGLGDDALSAAVHILQPQAASFACHRESPHPSYTAPSLETR